MEVFSSSASLSSARWIGRSYFAGSRTHLAAAIARTRSNNCNCRFGRRSIVDGDMAILRKRIRDLKMTEEGDEDHMARAPEEWMGWEKQYYYEGYTSHVFAAVAELEEVLVRTRPLVALGLVGLILICVPTTGFILLTRLVDFVKSLLPLAG